MRFDPEAIPIWLRESFNDVRSENVLTSIDEDDCAVIRLGDQWLVISTDFINSSPAIIELGIGGWYDLGRLVVCQNLSDLAGTAARPLGLLLGVCAPSTTNHSDIQQLLIGAKDQADRYTVPIIGGDTKVGSTRSIYGTAFGVAEDRKSLLLRSGAKVGDGIWVSGNLGSFASNVLAVGGSQGISESLISVAKQQLLAPAIPIEKSSELGSMKLDGAGTDITDGLWKDLDAICRSSHVGAEIRADFIPVSETTASIARQVAVDAWTFAFAAGGDFQFICTANEVFSRSLESAEMIRIGTVVPANGVELIISNNKRVSNINPGHQSARSRSFADEIRDTVNHLASI